MCCILFMICFLSSIIHSNTFTVTINEVSHPHDYKLVNFRILENKNRKNGNGLLVELGSWILLLDAGPSSISTILMPGLKTEWTDEFGYTNYFKNIHSCKFKTGVIQKNENDSKVILTICDNSIFGYLKSCDETYFIHPQLDNSTTSSLFKRIRRESTNGKKSLQSEWLYNLTGDIFDIDNREDVDANSDLNDENFRGHNFSLETDIYNEKFIIHEDNGYFLDNTWSAHDIKLITPSNVVAPQKWLKMAIGVDSTVIHFHGKQKVEQYILALMNIVSAIYEDPSLNANTKLVITRLIFYEHSKHNIIRPGNAKRSLENVNKWNRRLYQSLGPDELKHDLALWITRSDIGGPSGYSPVGGTCDPKRSCALTRDEGLSSAFILAHEMGHILGMSHDGDHKSNNFCDNETSMGSIMSPMVYATFNKFLWSECSKLEYQKLSSQWTCLQRAPSLNETVIPLNMTLKTVFDMDEQCRMEFGEGYRMCRVFDIIEPCTHLWCGHEQSALVCKTKKGPPLEGTECGFGKWCVNGYCEEVQQSDSGGIPVVLNPQNGGWSDWTPYGSCSRTCGIGVSFRSRKCDNPAPSYGGKTCNGTNEEWKVCDLPPCSDNVDIRAKQCKHLPKSISANDGFNEDEDWQPLERNSESKKCKLTCMGKKYKNMLLTNENLIDGTRCSYENEDNICVQGKCVKLGCDRKLSSDITRDSCGVCGGNNSGCINFKSSSRKRLKLGISKLVVLSQEARHIHLQVQLPTKLNIAFALKDRLTANYVVLVPNTKNNSEIFQGARFFYSHKRALNIWAHGPILRELLVLIIVSNTEISRGQYINTLAQYSNHKKNLMAIKNFIWMKGGWGPCSVACGGGKRKKTVACWDSQAKRIVKRKYCSLLQKPVLETEVCNIFSCNFEWITGEWEHCSKTCGDSGVQQREVYCVPSSALTKVLENNNNSIKLDELGRHMVSPNNCKGQLPVLIRSCNRKLCLSYWSFGNWSRCSTSCGPGYQIRSATCPHSPEESLYTCGESIFSEQKRDCYLGSCKRERKEKCRNYSKYCLLKVIHKYCVLNSFRKKCCSSCLSAVV